MEKKSSDTAPWWHSRRALDVVEVNLSFYVEQGCICKVNRENKVGARERWMALWLRE